MKSTNYHNTFIETADDAPTGKGEIPPVTAARTTAANIQFDMISKNPYRYTSDDVLFEVYAQKNDLSKSELSSEREKFFSKGQPCLRASPLTKRYGWGIHSDKDGKIAMFGMETDQYNMFANDKTLGHVKAMRSKRNKG